MDDRLPFDPDTIRDAIREHERLARAYRGLLEAHGLPIDRPPAQRVEGAHLPSGAILFPPMVSHGNTIADAAVASMKPGEWIHGQTILDNVRKQGFLLEAKAAMSSLYSALTRDPRIQKHESQGNTWRVKPAEKEAM
jgi:hypothetical protein